MAHKWRHMDGALRATTLFNRLGSRYHLAVEILPDRDWDWLVWRAGDADRSIRYGVAASAESAMAHAEAAAARLLADEPELTAAR
jgi:hypothetical protein